MHPDLMRQLAADRVEELRAAAAKSRRRRVLHADRAAEASQALARREWRVLVHALFAR
jgi:hypothetical protein